MLASLTGHDLDKNIFVSREEVGLVRIRWVWKGCIDSLEAGLFQRRPIIPNWLGPIDNEIVVRSFDYVSNTNGAKYRLSYLA